MIFFETQDLSSPNIPVKKLCSTYGLEFFSLEGTGQDMCALKANRLIFSSNCFILASSGGQIVQPIQKIFSPANANGCHKKCQEVLEV